MRNRDNGCFSLARARLVLPDIIVCDLALPALDGVALARTLRRDPITALIPMVAVTGYWTTSIVEDARATGFTRIFLKPCLPEELVAAIREVLRSRRPRVLAADYAGLRRFQRIS